jgi:FAD:protein FMN transferase
MIRAAAVMGTIVTVHVVDHRPGPPAGAPPGAPDDHAEAVARALDWFARVEACCSRFDLSSELMQLSRHIGVAVPVSAMLYEVVQFAVAVAAETGGAFDPTVGREMETRGFNREHRTRQVVRTPLAPGGAVSYRDVDLDRTQRTIALRQPLILDLGAVAKGFAIDMAARELQPFGDFAVDAGGDLYLGGRSPAGTPWSIGIRHPRRDRHLIESLHVSNAAVCTSGDYARRSADPLGGHHILDPRTGTSREGIASVTVVAPTAMAADALATAAFVLGPQEGIRLLERQAVEGLIVSTALERYETRGMASAYGCRG